MENGGRHYCTSIHLKKDGFRRFGDGVFGRLTHASMRDIVSLGPWGSGREFQAWCTSVGQIGYFCVIKVGLFLGIINLSLGIS